MQETETILTEYSYKAISGTVYHPVVKNNKWYIINDQFSRTFFEILYLCNISDEDAVALKLKYGG